MYSWLKGMRGDPSDFERCLFRTSEDGEWLMALKLTMREDFIIYTSRSRYLEAAITSSLQQTDELTVDVSELNHNRNDRNNCRVEWKSREHHFCVCFSLKTKRMMVLTWWLYTSMNKYQEIHLFLTISRPGVEGYLTLPFL